MPENIGVIDATPKPETAKPGLTITLKSGPSEITPRLVERWPNVLKIRIGYLNIDDIFAIMELLISEDEIQLPEGEVLEEGNRLRTYREQFRLWYIATEADDTMLMEGIDLACKRLNNGRPLASVAPLLASSLLPERDGSADSGANTQDSPSTPEATNGESSSTASTKPSGETNAKESKTSGSKTTKQSSRYTPPKLTKSSKTDSTESPGTDGTPGEPSVTVLNPAPRGYGV